MNDSARGRLEEPALAAGEPADLISVHRNTAYPDGVI